jgi:hypothetical protein
VPTYTAALSGDRIATGATSDARVSGSLGDTGDGGGRLPCDAGDWRGCDQNSNNNNNNSNNNKKNDIKKIREQAMTKNERYKSIAYGRGKKGRVSAYRYTRLCEFAI